MTTNEKALQRYLKVEFYPTSQYDLEVILAKLVTTLDDRVAIIDADANAYVIIYNDAELVQEVFVLGMTFNQLQEQDGIKMPFVVSVVELAEPPVAGVFDEE